MQAMLFRPTCFLQRRSVLHVQRTHVDGHTGVCLTGCRGGGMGSG